MHEQEAQPGKELGGDAGGGLHPSSLFSRTLERKSEAIRRPKRRYLIIGLLSLAALALFVWVWGQISTGKPEGQVLAVVGGEEIRETDLEAEARAAGWDLEKPAARQALLNSLIERQILVKEARSRGLATDPGLLSDFRRTEHVLLAKALSEQITASVSQPSDQEIAAFLDREGKVLQARQHLLLEQLRFAPASAVSKNEIARVQTLDQAEAMLRSKGVQSQRVQTVVDTLNLSPATAAQLLNVPDGEIFYSPEQNFGIFSRVMQRKMAPLSKGEQLKAAGVLMRRQRFEAAYRQTLERLRARADVKMQKLSAGSPE